MDFYSFLWKVMFEEMRTLPSRSTTQVCTCVTCVIREVGHTGQGAKSGDLTSSQVT